MIREILIQLGFIYDPGRFALKPSVTHAPPVVARPQRPPQVQHTKNLNVPYKETAETNQGAGLVSWEVMTTQEAATGGKASPLTAEELQAIELKRKETKLSLPVDFCQEVKNRLAKGLSIKQIEKDFKGVRGASARTIAAISSAINQAKK